MAVDTEAEAAEAVVDMLAALAAAMQAASVVEVTPADSVAATSAGFLVPEAVSPPRLHTAACVAGSQGLALT